MHFRMFGLSFRLSFLLRSKCYAKSNTTGGPTIVRLESLKTMRRSTKDLKILMLLLTFDAEIQKSSSSITRNVRIYS